MNMHVFCVLLSWMLAVSSWAFAADAPAAKPGPEAAEFNRVFAQWKDVLAKLGTLKVQYRTADAKTRPDIEEQWKKLIDQAAPLQEKLIETAQKAYAEAPNADPKVTEMLVGVLADWNERDDYERSYALGKLLMDNKCEDKHVPGLAGIAAFCVNEFDTAETWLKQAAANRVLDRVGEMDLDNIAYYKRAWAKEQELRAAEAKANDLPRVLMKTNRGDIEIELFENEAPIAVANFVSLVDQGFYNNKDFHRVLAGFMAQGGCPKGDGTGGPGYNIPCECYEPNHRLHFRGTLSMAHAGRDTGGSQFFLTFVPTTHLDGKHTVFGRVIKGMDVLAQLKRRDPSRPDGAKADKIVEAKVERKRAHEYVPKKTGQ